MPSLNAFESNVFSTSSLTESINKLPMMPGRLGSMGLFSSRGVPTTTVWIEEKHGTLRLLKSSPRGTIGNMHSGRSRHARQIGIPHFSNHGGILADNIQNVRQFGNETALAQIASEVNEEMSDMKADHEATWEYLRSGAIQGVVKDGDTTTTLVNLFTLFGITEKVIDLDADGAGDAEDSIIEAKRHIKDSLGASRWSGLKVLCSRTWFDTFVGHDDVKDAYARWKDGQFARTDNRESGFEIWGVKFEEYDENIGSTKFIPEGEARMVPMGVNKLFRRYNAPAPFMETVNTKGKPIYVKKKKMDYDLGVELMGVSCPLFICTRPAVLVKFTFS